MATFEFAGKLAITLRIGGQQVELVGTAELSSIASMTLEYKEPFDTALDLGTFDDALRTIGTLAAPGKITLNGKEISDPTVLNDLLESAKALPGFEFLKTRLERLPPPHVKLTALSLELSSLLFDPSVDTLPAGDLTVGLGLDFRDDSATLVGIKLETVTLLVKLAVTA